MSTLQQYRYGQVGLGFKLFGKTIRLGSVIKKVLDKVIDFTESTINNFTGGLFSGYLRSASEYLKTQTLKLEFALSPNIQKLAVANTLSTTEERTLEIWVDAKLMPFVKVLSTLLGQAKDADTPAEKAKMLSEVALMMDAVQTHFDSYDTAGLSQLGIDTRALLISNAFYPINEVVKEMVKQIGGQTQPTSGNPQGIDFYPLFTSTPLTQVPTERYTATNSPVKTPGLPIKNGSDLTLGELPSIKVPDRFFSEGKESKDNTALIVGGVVLGGIAIYAATRKKKPSGMNGRRKARINKRK